MSCQTWMRHQTNVKWLTHVAKPLDAQPAWFPPTTLACGADLQPLVPVTMREPGASPQAGIRRDFSALYADLLWLEWSKARIIVTFETASAVRSVQVRGVRAGGADPHSAIEGRKTRGESNCVRSCALRSDRSLRGRRSHPGQAETWPQGAGRPAKAFPRGACPSRWKP